MYRTDARYVHTHITCMRKDARYVHVLRRTIIKNAPMGPLDSAFTSDTWCIIRMGPLYRYIHVPCVYVISCIKMEGTGEA